MGTPISLKTQEPASSTEPGIHDNGVRQEVKLQMIAEGGAPQEHRNVVHQEVILCFSFTVYRTAKVTACRV